MDLLTRLIKEVGEARFKELTKDIQPEKIDEIKALLKAKAGTEPQN